MLAAFDAFIASRGYVNRSEAIRDLIRDVLIDDRLANGNEPVVAVVTFVCDHRSAAAPVRARRAVIEAEALHPSCAQIPIDDQRDLWVISVRGPSGTVQSFSNRIRAVRGLSTVRTLCIPIAE